MKEKNQFKERTAYRKPEIREDRGRLGSAGNGSDSGQKTKLKFQ